MGWKLIDSGSVLMPEDFHTLQMKSWSHNDPEAWAYSLEYATCSQMLKLVDLSNAS